MADVCSLFLQPGPTITPATSEVAANGSVQVAYGSTNPHHVVAPRFVIYPQGSPIDPPYSSRTNTSGLFTALVPGTYVVNARDSDTCVQELTVIIGYDLQWGPRWRVEHGSINGLKIRVDIEDNQFTEDVTYVTADGEPEILQATNDAGDNVFTPVIGTELQVNLISPTEGYFDDLNGFDEKRFRATYYLNDGVFVENGDFDGSISPADNTGAQTNAWTYVVSAAEATLPSSFVTTKGLRIPFATKRGVKYTITLNFDILAGAGSAGDSTRLFVYLTDDFTLPSPDNATIDALPIGTGQSASITITPTGNRAYLVIAAGNLDSSSFGRVIDIGLVESDGGWAQKWQGFVIPQNSDEEYCRLTDYPVSFTFSDGLADLSKIEFSDDSGNKPLTRISIMQAVLFCLNKTGLELPIWETINFYALGMNSGTDDSTLPQAYFDPRVYQNDDGTFESCLTVLESLMTNLAARITQSDGVWAIDCPTLKTGSVTPTRKFDHEGTFIESEDRAYRIMLRSNTAPSPKIVFKDCSGRKSHQTMYGKLVFTFDFDLDENNLLQQSDFKDIDVSNGQLNGWNIFADEFSIINDDFTPEIVSIDKDGKKKDVLKISFKQSGTGVSGRNCTLRSVPIEITPTTEPYILEISFDVMVKGNNDKGYIFFDYRVRLEDSPDLYYVSPFNTNQLRSDVDDALINGADGHGYLRKYMDGQDNWETVTIRLDTISPAGGGGLQPLTTGGILDLALYFYANQPFDVDGISDLKDSPTVFSISKPGYISAGSGFALRTADRIRVHDQQTDITTSIDTIRQYKLRQGNDAEDIPNIVRPNDMGFQAPYNYVWELTETLVPNDVGVEPHEIPWLQAVYVDNVRIKYLPASTEPETELSTEIVLNSNVKIPLELTFRHGDLPTDNNYKNLIHGWLSLPDGTPTTLWKYKELTAPSFELPILELIRNLYQGQYGVDMWRLSGNVLCKGILPFIGLPVYEVRTGRIYTIVTNGISGRTPIAMIQMIESLAGEPVIDDGANPDPGTEPPVSTADYAQADYDTTDYFTD